MTDPAEERSTGGLSGALAQLAASLIALVRTRLELATVEFEEERERIKGVLMLAVVAAVFLCFALIAFSALILALFWQTHPLLAILGMALFYAVVGAGALAMLRNRERPRAFAATLAELEKDAGALRGKR